jgi:hypothetical protein
MKITLPSRSVRIAQTLHKRRKLPKWGGNSSGNPGCQTRARQQARERRLGSSRDPCNAATNCVVFNALLGRAFYVVVLMLARRWKRLLSTRFACSRSRALA